MPALIILLIIPFVIINSLGGIISGVWLAFLGEWWALGVGVVVLVAGHYLMPLSLAPQVVALGPAILLLKKSKILAAPFFFFGIVITNLVVSGWCLAIFWYYLSRSSEDSQIPFLLWSYGIATTPWLRMDDSVASNFSSFFALTAYIVAMIIALFFHTDFADIVYVFLSIMVAQRAVGVLVDQNNKTQETTKVRKIVCMPSAEEAKSISHYVGAAPASSNHSLRSLGHLTR